MPASPGNVTIREADTIWREEGGWFYARWHFSFDRYRDPEQMGVGALRVFNDDRIVAGAEWPLQHGAAARRASPRRPGKTAWAHVREGRPKGPVQLRFGP